MLKKIRHAKRRLVATFRELAMAWAIAAWRSSWR